VAAGAALSLHRVLFLFFTMSKTATTPSAGELLRSGVWSVEQVACMLDTPECIVTRWCVLRLIPGVRQRAGAWQIPGPGLFFLCKGQIELRYSAETIGAMLDISPDTVRDWIKHGRLKKCKWGLARSAPVRVAESELVRFLKGGDA
jgi:hypothetical protein